MELKYQNDYHNQAGANDFQRSIWIFSGCWLSPAWYNTDCSQFDHYQLQLVHLNVEHHPARKSTVWHFTNFWQIQSVTALSPHTAQIFVFQLHFYLFWNNKHNMLKMLLFSSIFNIKIATQKFANISFFSNALWYDNCIHYNLGKLFHMKFKDS